MLRTHMLNCIILTKEGEKPECFSNLSKMAKAKGVNVRKYDTKEFPFLIVETGQTCYKLPRL